MKISTCILLVMTFFSILILPSSVEGTPHQLRNNVDSNLSGGENSFNASNDLIQFYDNEKQVVKYSDLQMKIEYSSDELEVTGSCRVTLNGTIETDIGTITFDNVVIEVSLDDGQDCGDFAIRLLKSFQ